MRRLVLAALAAMGIAGSAEAATAPWYPAGVHVIYDEDLDGDIPGTGPFVIPITQKGRWMITGWVFGDDVDFLTVLPDNPDLQPRAIGGAFQVGTSSTQILLPDQKYSFWYIEAYESSIPGVPKGRWKITGEYDPDPPIPAPLPASAFLLLAGIGGLAIRRRLSAS